MDGLAYLASKKDLDLNSHSKEQTSYAGVEE
jgi:hypothetical protein